MPKIIQITGVRTNKGLWGYLNVDQEYMFGNKNVDFEVNTYFINADYIKEIIKWDNGAVVILDKNDTYSREDYKYKTTPDYIYTAMTVEELMKSING